ncbi:MAG TPA: hypothetical protein VE127_14305, partial [Solirubrobacteraceae bacterium]|nr:hypothetical protein [Solirubrobacteraceae bacterium]
RVTRTRAGSMQIRLTSARTRFKYLGYTLVSGTHLVIQLWKSRPPSRAAEIRRGTGGCLTLDRSSVTTGVVTASGRSHGLFENQGLLTLRGADGRVVTQRTVHVVGGRWSGRLTYRARRQAGTLEAHAASAKDGSVGCIVQIRVTIPASPPPLSVKVLSRYPQQCLRAAGRPGGDGRVATMNARTVTIATPSGENAATIRFAAPPMGSYMGSVRYLQWSPDGRWLALRWGDLFTASATPAGMLFPSAAIGAWTWSPANDCVLAITKATRTETTISVGAPHRTGAAFLRGRIGPFAFSPNGRALYLGLGGPSASPRFARVDLASGRVRDIGPAPGLGCCLGFGGWAPGGKILLFWGGYGASVMSDGVDLQGIDTAHNNRIVTYGTKSDHVTILPGGDSLATCGDRLLAVVGVGRILTTVSDKRLAFVAPGRAPVYLTPKTVAYLSPSCAPDGTAVAAVRYGNGARIAAPAPVAIISVKTGGTRQLAPTGSLTDSAPEWGPAGILYARTANPSTPFQLWFAPLGAGARDSGLRATGLGDGGWDWSATPPGGTGG